MLMFSLNGLLPKKATLSRYYDHVPHVLLLVKTLMGIIMV